MVLQRTKARARVLRNALRSLASIAWQNGNARQIASRLIWVAANEGVGGVKARVLYLAGYGHQQDQPYHAPATPPMAPTYEEWCKRFDSLQPKNIADARRHCASISLSEVLIVAWLEPGDLPGVQAMVASWALSIHQAWRAVLVLPAGQIASDSDVLKPIMESDSRVTVINTATEIAAQRTGFTHTLLCFGQVRLNALSLYMLAEAAERTLADIVYADNDHVDPFGRRSDPALKPRFSPTYIEHHNYIGDCLLISDDVTLPAEDLVQGRSSSRDAFDAMVASLVTGRSVEHVPFILSHIAGDRTRAKIEVSDVPDDGPSVTIVIPTRDGLAYLKPCVESIRERTTYRADLVEIIIIDNASQDGETLAYLEEIAREPNIRVLAFPHPFNFSAINNFGAAHTERDVLVFLNNDTTVHDPRWLSKLVAQARRPDVGVVGAKLLFPDGSIQHGGCAAGGNTGTVSHLLMHAMPEAVQTTDHTREMSLLTGACCAIRRSVFNEIGGFDPVLRVTWNDVKLCLSCLEAGYRNIYVADPLLIHHEQKTRGAEDTPEKIERYFGEGNYVRRRFASYFYDDPSYNPNATIQAETLYAEPPRVRRPWTRGPEAPRRILILSTVYKFGFGVSIVIQQQVLKLQELGYDIVIGGPHRDNELPFPGCTRVLFDSSRDAAVYAFDNDVDLIICHTPPFFDIPLTIGGHIPVLSYDYGEPPASRFPEPVHSYLRNVERQKRASAALTTQIATISQAVKDETLNADAIVVGLANSHLPRWTPDLVSQRAEIRNELGWDQAFVVLTVSRFGVNERAYKGLDQVATIAREFPFIHPEYSGNLVWALAGAGDPDDIRQVEDLGFTVFPNVPDSRMAELYMAADAYVSYSRWEGYNLGISQALAMGLPIIASDIPAHREFPIFTTNSTLASCAWLAGEVQAARDGTRHRTATVYEWSKSVSAFSDIVGRLVEQGRSQMLS